MHPIIERSLRFLGIASPNATMSSPPSHAQINESLHRAIVATPPDAQLSSPLMTRLPPEIRNDIFKLVLTEYVDQDPRARYNQDTPFARPSYSAPRRTDTQLLATCRAIYRDCWLMPHILREEVHWLTGADRAPPDYVRDRGIRLLARRLQVIARNLTGAGGQQDGSVNREEVESEMAMSNLRVFTQLCELEPGYSLRSLVSLQHLRFRRLTITLRHTDWWFWESDEPLQIKTGRWIEILQSVLPSSVTEVALELETLERKKDQIMNIAKQMSQKWYFQRNDGVTLFADITALPKDEEEEKKPRDDEHRDGEEEGEATTSESRTEQQQQQQQHPLVHRWSGSSTLNGETWLRDETAPGRLDYYVLTVPFRLQRVVEAGGGKVSSEVLRAARDNNCSELRRPLRQPHREEVMFGVSAELLEEDWGEDEEGSESEIE